VNDSSAQVEDDNDQIQALGSSTDAEANALEPTESYTDENSEENQPQAVETLHARESVTDGAEVQEEEEVVEEQAAEGEHPEDELLDFGDEDAQPVDGQASSDSSTIQGDANTTKIATTDWKHSHFRLRI